LFDLSTIPTCTIDFHDIDVAKEKLRAALADRLTENSLLHDARVQQAIQSLTPNELHVLQVLAALPDNKAQDLSIPELGQLSIPTESGLSLLLAKSFARAVAINPNSGSPYYKLTPVGRAVAVSAAQALKHSEPESLKPAPPQEPSAA
jgi:hypothetical protein